MFKLTGEYFCGNKISDYGIENGYLDYGTMAKAFDAVLCNSIACRDTLEPANGLDYDEETDEYTEIFQYYIVSDNAVDILSDANEPLFYDSELDIYVWGVTHFGTSWSYVLTDIPCNCKE